MSDTIGERDNLGLATGKSMDKNPTGNQSIVYNPAKRPSQPGAFLPGQAISDLTFLSGYNQRRIRILMNPGDNPTQPAGTIFVIDEHNNVLLSMGDKDTSIVFINPHKDINALSLESDLAGTADVQDIRITNSGSSATALSIANAGTGFGIFIVMTNTSVGQAIEMTAGGIGLSIINTDGIPLSLQQNTAITTNFYKIASYVVPGRTDPVTIWMSDGSQDPDTILNGKEGDFCFGGIGGTPSWCFGGTAWSPV